MTPLPFRFAWPRSPRTRGDRTARSRKRGTARAWRTRVRPCLLLLALAACTDPPSDAMFFTYDDRQLLCAFAIDDYLVPTDWDRLQARIDDAVANAWVVNVYAHSPGVTIDPATLERAFSMFDAAGLAYLTYPDLEPGDEPVAGVAFGFDDDGVETWTQIRPLLERHHARVTFFVTRFDTFTDDQKTQLAALAADGHAIESHTLHHLEAHTYPGGAQAYYDEEVAPEIALLRAGGYTPESFAYPYGSRTAETDAAIGPHVRLMRTTPGSCPY